MRQIRFLSILMICSSHGFLLSNNLQNEWKNFQNKHGITYESAEEAAKRFTIFARNLKKIDEHNHQYQMGRTTWMMGVTQFADRTTQEFSNYIKQSSKNFQSPKRLNRRPVYIFTANDSNIVPRFIDWREKGVRTKVSLQSPCASCWAFSAVAALESHAQIYLKVNVTLSVQSIVDCAVRPEYYNDGCYGGHPTEAYNYVQDKGIVDEKSYPYEAEKKPCRRNTTSVITTIGGYAEVAEDEESMRQAVGIIGPVSASIEATENLQHYKSGIYQDPKCTDRPNHALLAIGYGRKNGTDYWLLKNSYGVNWGEEGYMKILRNHDMTCSIGKMGAFPVMK